MTIFRPPLAGIACLIALSAAASEPIAVHLELPAAVDGRPCRLHLGLVDGRVTAGFADGYNAFPVEVDCSGLEFVDGAVLGAVTWTVAPDPWLPKDHEDIPCRFELYAELTPGGVVTGRFEGTWRDRPAAGELIGSHAPDTPAQHGRFEARIFQAFYRLSPAAGARGPNTGYALDMKLGFPLRDGEAVLPYLESVVPDYRGYSAAVKECDYEADGLRFRCAVAAELDTGQQGGGRNAERGIARREDYRYELSGLVIGGRVAGRCRIAVADIEGVVPFWGSFDRRPPPVPAGNRAWLRLHRAMRSEFPVLLDLALDPETGVHGQAWTPRYNHQPQPIDAADLRLEGERLHGPVTINVRPDCYHDKDVHFVLRYELDCTFREGELRGTFTGRDGDLETAGEITGSLRHLDPPAVDWLKLRKARFDLGLALPAAEEKGNRFIGIELECTEGAVTGGRVVWPRNPEREPVPLALDDASMLQLSGACLKARTAFRLSGDPATAGDYVYMLEARVDGRRLHGLWMGERDGKPILTKSAKLGGKLFGSGTYEDRRLVLPGALPGGRELLVFLREDDAGGAAFGLGPRYNRMTYRVTAESLDLREREPHGQLQLVIPSDGWVPPESETREAELRLADGRYSGRVGGERVEGGFSVEATGRRWESGPARLALYLERGARAKNGQAGRLTLHLGFVDGVCVGGRAAPPGSITDTGFATRLLAHDLCLAEGRLRGWCRYLVRGQGAMAEPREHRLELDLPVIAGRGGGVARLWVCGQGIITSPLRVLVADEPPADPADARYTLALPGALPDGNYLLLQLALRDGRAGGAILTAPNWNNAIHRVEACTVAYREGLLEGEIRYALLPDPWKPKNRQPVAGCCRLRACVHGGIVRGRSGACFSGDLFVGAVEGEVHALAATEPAYTRLTLKLEDALTGGAAWHNRVFLGMRIEDATVTGGRVSNNHTDLTGRVDGGSWRLEGDRFTAAVDFTVTGGGVDAGAYSAEVRGQRVGDLVAGEFTCTRAGGAAKTGSFWGRLGTDVR